MKHLYNTQIDDPERLDNLTCGEDRHALLEQLLVALREERKKNSHQHHLIIGPRGSGKTHLLRVLVANRVPKETSLKNAYLPIVLPEETPVRSPADLLLKILERLAGLLALAEDGMPAEIRGKARAACLTAAAAAAAKRDPLERLPIAGQGLADAAEILGRILLPVVENIDSLFYLGIKTGRRRHFTAHWALRSHLQQARHLLLIAAAPSIFGAVGDPDAPFYDFFRVHKLQELSNDEVLEIIHKRVLEEHESPGSDQLRATRINNIHAHFHQYSPRIRGALVITGGIPRYAHLVYDVIVETDVQKSLDVLNGFIDQLTPYFQQRLDPRLIPEPEMEILDILATARGPLQPRELAERSYGGQVNEVAELLDRLCHRGFVKRAGRPDGRAVTWDVTEPLYRVWKHFRSCPTDREQFLLLAEFVVALFSIEEIAAERSIIEERILKDSEPAGRNQRSLQKRKLLLDIAIEAGQERKKELIAKEGLSSPFAQDATGPEMEEILNDLRQKVYEGLAGAPERRYLAIGLFNTLVNAKEDDDLKRRDALLDELRQLAGQFPNDAEVCKQLAGGLVNTLVYAKDEDDLTRRDTLLGELRQLAGPFPNDAEVRKQLAMGLFNTLVDAKDEDDIARRDALLDELRQMARWFPDDAEVHKQLAMGLFNTLVYAKDEDDLTRRDALLDELRQLTGRFPDDVEVHEPLARGLVNTHIEAKDEDDLTRSDALLNELRQLAGQFSDNAEMRKQLAMGLFNALVYTKEEDDLARRDALLDELRQLAGQFPDDAEVRKRLAQGLFNALVYAKDEDDLARRDALLDELRQLAGQFSDHAEVRQRLAMGLFNTLVDAKEEDDLAKRDALLDELRQLVGRFPDHAEARELLAMGLFNTLVYTKDKDDLARRDTLLDELRQLAGRFPEDPFILFCLGKALISLPESAEEGEAQKLLERAGQLYAAVGNRKAQADCLLDMARLAKTGNKVETALDYLRKALSLHQAAANSEGIIRSLDILTGVAADAIEDEKLFSRTMELIQCLEPGITEKTGEEPLLIFLQNIGLKLLARAGQSNMLKKLLPMLNKLDAQLPEEQAGFLQPFFVALDVLKHGEEKAMAREPEEMRRTVRLLLEHVKHEREKGNPS